MQQAFIIFIDICLLVMIVLDAIMLIRNRKRDMAKMEADMDYELEKLILETKKDLQMVDMLSDLDNRLTKIEKQLNKEEK